MNFAVFARCFFGFLYSEPLHLLCSSYLLCFNSKQEWKRGYYWKQIIPLHCCWHWPSKLTDAIFLEWVLALKSVGAFPLVKLHKHMYILRIRAADTYPALRVAITCRLRSSSLDNNIQTPWQSRTVAWLLYLLPNRWYKGFTLSKEAFLQVWLLLYPWAAMLPFFPWARYLLS